MQPEAPRFSSVVGEEYDLFSLATPHHDDIQRDTVDALVSHFDSATKKIINVLEIGFGTGLTSIALLRANTRISLTAIDSEPEMLPKAHARLNEFKESGRLTLTTDDALTYLRLCKDASYDAVISVWTLHNIHHLQRSEILYEIHRVLTPGGIFVTGDKMAVDNTEEHSMHLRWQLAQFDVFEHMGRSELKKEWVDHYHTDEEPERILYESALQKNLRNLGFQSCDITKRWHMDAIAVAHK